MKFRRDNNRQATISLNNYWDALVGHAGAETLPGPDTDPEIARIARHLDQVAVAILPDASFVARLEGQLLVHQRESAAMIAPLTAPDVRWSDPAPHSRPARNAASVRWLVAAAAACIVLGIAMYGRFGWFGDDAPPVPVIPAVMQSDATPEASPAGTPAVMVNPNNIAAIWQWDLPPEYNQNDGLDQFLRVAIGPDGTIYAIDPDADGAIHLLDADGTQTGTWGSPGTEPGAFNFALPSSTNPLPGGDIDFDAEGNIYVFDSGNDRIQKFSPDRQFIREWPIEGSDRVEYNKPLGAVDPVNERVYVVTELYPRVQVFDLEGNLLNTWGEFGGKEGQFRAPSDVAVAPDGTVWISDKGIARIQHFDADGAFLGMIGGERGGEPGQFNQVTGLFIDNDYNIYVADFGNGRIQVVRPDGTPLLAFTVIGGTERIAGAYSLWVDDEGSLYVGDSYDDRVLKLQLPPLH